MGRGTNRLITILLLVLVASGGFLLFYWGGIEQQTGARTKAPFAQSRTSSDRAGILDKDDPAVVVRVAVLDGKTKDPIPTIEYRLEPTSRKGWVSHKDLAGVFGLPEAFDEKRILRVRSAGYMEQSVEITQADLAGDGAQQILVVLEPGQVIQGTVLDDQSGRALPGVRVRGISDPSMLWQWNDVPVVLSKARGHFMLRSSGSLTCAFLAFEHNYFQPILVPTPEKVQDELPVRMKPGGLLSCQVTHAAERVYPARVMVVHPGKVDEATCFNRWFIQEKNQEIRFPGLKPGHYVALIEAGTPLASWGLTVVHVEKGRINNYTWAMEDFGGLFGRLEGFGDTTDMTVELRMVSMPEIRLAEPAVNAAGEFEIGFIPQGVYILRVFPAGGGIPLADQRVTILDNTWDEVVIKKALSN